NGRRRGVSCGGLYPEPDAVTRWESPATTVFFRYRRDAGEPGPEHRDSLRVVVRTSILAGQAGPKLSLSELWHVSRSRIASSKFRTVSKGASSRRSGLGTSPREVR